VDQWLSSPAGSGLALLARIGIGSLLTASGLVKIWGGHQRFRNIVEAYELLPRWAIAPAALLIPWLEIAIGLGVLIGTLWPLPVVAAAVLLAAFAVALAINVRRGHTNLDCGCFADPHSRTLSWRSVVGRVALASVSLVVAYAPPDWAQDGLVYAFFFTLGLAGVWILLRALSVMTQEWREAGS
jgi:uncharacterized membrane protein YphA (DoxX/SURF4 family)